MNNTKVVLLFGAGASYGSGILNPPPLSKDLYESLHNSFGETWGKIDNKYDTFFSPNFEKGMEWLYSEDGQKSYNLNNLLRDLAIYFDGFHIDNYKPNLYSQLINKFKKEIIERRIVPTTLNYECLLEYAYFSNGINTISYQGSDHPPILKIHGSCNFIPEGFKGSTEGFTLNLEQATIVTSIRPCKPGTVSNELRNVPIIPAMSLFKSDKRDIVSPQFIAMIREQYQQLVTSASVVITVGVRPNPDDQHVWTVLKSVPKLYLVGNKDDSEKWRLQHPNSIFLGAEFGSSFNNILSIIRSAV